MNDIPRTPLLQAYLEAAEHGLEIRLRRRSWFGRLLCVPGLAIQHYRILRRHRPFFAAVYDSVVMALFVVRS